MENRNVQEFNKFLKNNNELLQDKYKQHFVHDQIKISSKEPRLETVVNFISDVFMIERNQGEQPGDGKQRVKQSLRLSYQSFLKVNKDIKQFNVSVAIQLLRFCIQSNQMFAVQYQNSKDGQQASSNRVWGQLKKRQISNKNQTDLAKNKTNDNGSQYKDGQNSNSNNQFAFMSNINGQGSPSQDSSLQQAYKKIKSKNTFDDGQLSNEFNFQQQIKVDIDPVLVKKNLKIVFQYYCKQQMALSPNISFQRIQRESHMLTMSKMLLMAKMMNMISGSITRQMIISRFRKISEGKRQIDFVKFDALMSHLQIQDSTLVARAQLNSPNIHLYLKTTKKPFDTQDMLPRQLVKNRMFTKKLTLHSGKLESDLIQDLKLKKSLLPQQNYQKISPSRIKFQSHISQASEKQTDMKSSRQRYNSQVNNSNIRQQYQFNRRESQIIKPSSLGKSDRNYSQDITLMKVKRIIPVDIEDDKWLNEYKISSSIKKAKAFDENFEKKRSFEDRERNSMLIRDLKNRIMQIEKTEISSSGLQETKPYLFSSNRRY